MKHKLRWLFTAVVAVGIMRILWMIGIQGFISWMIGFWIFTLVMATDSLIRFSLSERRKKRFGK